MISFAGVSSDEANVIVERFPSRPIPARRYTVQQIPGRSGDLLFDQGAYDNITQTYEVYVNHNGMTWQQSMRLAAAWMSAPGYQELWDSYDPETFRLAYFAGPADFSNALNQLGRATINFSCKPWRFLFSGTTPVTLTASGSIENHTDFNALPLIQIRGSGAGQLEIDGYIVNISDIDDGMTIDSELMDCYSGQNNRNSLLTLTPQFEFPQLQPGVNNIVISGGITSVIIRPRWRSL